MAVRVHSKKELQKALKAAEKEIYVYGEAAEKIAKLNRAKKLIPLIGGLGAAGISVLALSAPVSGGTSLAAGSALAAHLTAGTAGASLTLSTAEVEIIVGAIVSLGIGVIEAICKNYDVITMHANDGNLMIKLEKK